MQDKDNVLHVKQNVWLNILILDKLLWSSEPQRLWGLVKIVESFISVKFQLWVKFKTHIIPAS